MTLDADELIDRLRDLAPRLSTSLAQADEPARLPDDVVAMLIEQQLFRLWIPQRCGGLELDLPSTLRVYEAAAAIDGSLGWAVMIGCGGGLFGARLEHQAAVEIFGPADALIAGSGASDGRAERVAGGYRVTGRWRYASGAHHATTFTANCIVTEAGQPVLHGGHPWMRAMAFDRSQVQIIETWDTTGMRATGSHDFEVREAYVPERHSFTVSDGPPYEDGALYRVPFEVLTELPVAAVGIGILRHALEAFAVLARERAAAGRTWADSAGVQRAHATAHALWLQTVAATQAAARRAWNAAGERRVLSAVERAGITAVCVHAVSALGEAVAHLVGFAGMAGLERRSALARAQRDLAALAAHASVSPGGLAAAGAALLAG
jgi:alkylation response protein AidB-like acyl-CoA dehydrogenase